MLIEVAWLGLTADSQPGGFVFRFFFGTYTYVINAEYARQKTTDVEFWYCHADQTSLWAKAGELDIQGVGQRSVPDVVTLNRRPEGRLVEANWPSQDDAERLAGIA